MLVEFSITNFRSIKERQTLTMQAETTKSKRDTNTFDVELATGEKITLVKSAVVFGSNASGKSNVIRAFYNFKRFVSGSADYKAEQDIEWYDPFLFDTDTEKKPTKFEITFIGKDLIKYEYSVELNKHKIFHEELNYFPKKIKNNLFKRVVNDDVIHAGKLGADVIGNEITLFRNQLILSKFGKDKPDKILTDVYLYFTDFSVWNATNQPNIKYLREAIVTSIVDSKDVAFLNKLSRLVKVADTKLNEIVLPDVHKRTSASTSDSSEPDQVKLKQYPVFGSHDVYNNGQIVSKYELPFEQESAGTKILLALGGIILSAIQNGRLIVFDELDTSLHPRLSRFLVRLFNNEKFNTRNAQIVFTSHEANLLDKDMFRTDQIWFTAKNEKGITELYSAQDFDGIREDMPFDKWYLAGKFGAVPNIHEMEFIFGNEQSQ